MRRPTPMTTDWALGATMRKDALPAGSTIGYWYPGALSGEGLASAAGCVVGRVVADVAGAAWPSAVASTARNDTNSATFMRAEVMAISPDRTQSVRFN